MVGIKTDHMLAFRKFLTSPEDADRVLTREHLQALAGLLEDHIHYHHVPEFDPENCSPDNIHPYLWYGQSNSQTEVTLNCSTQYPDIIGINVEIYATDPTISQLIEDHCVNALSDYGNPKQGSPFGDITVQDVIVGPQDDDYIPAGNRFNVDIVWHIQSFQVSVYPLWCGCSDRDPSFGY